MEKIVFKKKLNELLSEINIEINENKIDMFYLYMQELLEWNKKINLTAIEDENEIILKHFIDSLTVQKYIKNAQNIIDIGTGAGFPGIPLAIVNEKSNIVLLDSLNKRINFLNNVIQKLELSNVKAIHGRAEDLAKIVQHRENAMKSYAGNPNSIADSVLSLLFDPQLAMNVTKNAKNKVKDEFNWQKIAQDTHYIYELAISKTMAQRQAEQLEQEKAKKTTKSKNTDKEITNLLSFKKRHAYA